MEHVLGGWTFEASPFDGSGHPPYLSLFTHQLNLIWQISRVVPRNTRAHEGISTQVAKMQQQVEYSCIASGASAQKSAFILFFQRCLSMLIKTAGRLTNILLNGLIQSVVNVKETGMPCWNYISSTKQMKIPSRIKFSTKDMYISMFSWFCILFIPIHPCYHYCQSKRNVPQWPPT